MRNQTSVVDGIAVLLLAGTLAVIPGCSRDRADGDAAEPGRALAGEHPRQRLFRMPAHHPVLQRFSQPARLHVLFHPDIGHCTPQEVNAARALRRIETEFDDVRVLTILPSVGAGIRATYGEDLPGERLTINDRLFALEGVIAPRPRVEVWSNDGRLLLMMGVPRATTEEKVYEEVLWSRAFTAPLEEEAGS